MHDLIVIAGGRGSRLGGICKPLLSFRGQSLLERAVRAGLATGARHAGVVGPAALAAALPADLTERVSLTQEEPPFAGPVAALAAGCAALPTPLAPWLLVLAADLPEVAPALPDLLGATRAPSTEAVIAVDPSRRRQFLTALYRTDSLRKALRHKPSSLRDLVAGLFVMEVSVPASAVADVDSWSDAARWGISHQSRLAARPGQHQQGDPQNGDPASEPPQH